MIHYLPLEPSRVRWTGFMDKVISAHLADKDHIKYDPLIPGTYGEQKLAPGAFYDPLRVIEYRSRQLALLAASSDLSSGDTVFLSDVLVPGIEAIAYMSHLAGINLEIRGLLHAGSFTDHDMMNPIERWAALHENAVFDLCSEIYVGSNWIRQDVTQKRLIDPSNVVVTGFPLDPDLPEPKQERELIVVFNGRLSREKQPWLFRKLADTLYPRSVAGEPVEFVNCIEQGFDKPTYYELLSRAKVVVSFAMQETFGTGVQEAVKLGCIPVVPASCCYPEQFHPDYLYRTFDEAVEKVHDALRGKLEVPQPVDCSGAVERWFA